MASICLI